MQSALEGLLPNLSPRGADALAALFGPRSYARNALLLREGEQWETAFVVERGLLRMHFARRDGREFNKNFHKENALLCPITEAMIEAPSLFSISAVERCIVWVAPAADLRRHLARENAWEPLRSTLLERLLTHKLRREHDLLALDGRTRYRNFCLNEPALAARVPLSQLASYLGLTDVSLSRIRRRNRDAPG